MKETLAQVIAAQKGLRPTDVTLDSTLADLGIDSLDAVDILMTLEDTLHVRLDMRRRVSTVQELLKLLEEAAAQG